MRDKTYVKYIVKKLIQFEANADDTFAFISSRMRTLRLTTVTSSSYKKTRDCFFCSLSSVQTDIF